VRDDWLEIGADDDEIDVREIMREIRARIAAREGAETEDVSAVARELWDEMIAPSAAEMELVPIARSECDIYPHDYRIEWRNPILGPINSVVRRVINLEIQRFLAPALLKQSSLNQRFLDALVEVARENRRLRYELDALRRTGD
jgi:hypothetical protein